MKPFLDAIRVNKLFVKILLSFLSFLLPLIALGALTYTNFVSSLKQDYADKLRLNLATSTETVEGFWQRINETATSFFSDPNVLRLMKPKPEWSEQDRTSLSYLQASISRAKFHVNAIVDELFVYVDHEYVFTANGINDFYPFFNKFYKYQHYTPAFWEERLREVRYTDVLKPMSVATTFGPKNVITFLSASQIGDHRALLVATVPVEKVWRTMAPILEHGVSRIIVVDNAGQIAMSSDEAFPNELALAAIKQEALAEGTGSQAAAAQEAAIGRNTASGQNAAYGQNAATGQETVVGRNAATGQGTAAAQGANFGQEAAIAREVVIDGNRYITDQSETAAIGWTFYTLTPVEAFNKQAAGILNFIVSLCLILCVISLIFAFVFSYRIYTPIRRIGEVLESSPAAEPEHADGSRPSRDLRHIGAGINRLLHNQFMHQGQLELLTQEYLDQSLLQVVRGQMLREDQQENLLRVMQSQLQFGQDQFLCCAVSLRFKERFVSEIQDVERIVIESKMKKLFFGLLKKRGNLYVLETGDSLYIMLFNVAGQEDIPPVKAGMQELVDIFSSDWKYCRLHIGIGTVHKGIEGIGRSYRDGVAALHQITNEPDYKIVAYTSSDRSRELVYTYIDENKLLQLLRIGNKASVVELVDELTRRNQDAYYSLNTLYANMHATGRRYLFEQGLEAEDLLTAGDQRLLLHPGRLPAMHDERKHALVSFLHRIIDLTASGQAPRKPSELAATIKAYVEANYTSDLHLEKIAEEMGISLKYVSRLFKETYHANITNFISELRINKAKELLRDTDLLVTAISKQVGIFDRTTFLRTFKKMEGLSPNDYRRQAREDAALAAREGKPAAASTAAAGASTTLEQEGAAGAGEAVEAVETAGTTEGKAATEGTEQVMMAAERTVESKLATRRTAAEKAAESEVTTEGTEKATEAETGHAGTTGKRQGK